MQLFHGTDEEYPAELGDMVEICAAEVRFPAVIKKLHPKSGEVTVSFEGLDPVLDMIILRKSARVPFSAVQFVERGA
ncbi:MAG: hypothetical protein EOS63_17345 [Mesorhizobium sp.]|uniref:hypothetical protein n=1 Tax=Mesorhizobium sp. TaxID=1871066 RepID=UPI000FE4B3F1|nr:hypothetical protein [Mesorhizobium sp.]RWE78521.1 MAG: hypothetical protein EOS63_17345 [Mesorhizobium sp.]TJW61029.1 MAG: hypothetical protein E5V97_22200 [Mesorhizobium sp.]